MAKPEWGTKHSCQSCGAKYYDLQRTPITCPKCGTQFDPDALLRSRRGRSAPAPAEAKPAKKPEKKVEAAEEAEVADDEDLEVEEEAEKDEDLGTLEEGEEDEDLIEDASELGEDDDDMAEVVIDEEKEEP